MKTSTRRPKRYCLVDELQKADYSDDRNPVDELREIMPAPCAEKLEAYTRLIRVSVNLKVSLAAEVVAVGAKAAQELSRVAVQGRCRVRLHPLQRLMDWPAHFHKDLPIAVPVLVKRDVLLFGDVKADNKTLIGRFAPGVTVEGPGIQSAHDMLPDLRQDELDARRDVIRLSRETELKGSTCTSYQALLQGIVLQTMLRTKELRNARLSTAAAGEDERDSITFSRYLRNTLTSVLLCLRAVNRTFAGSIMLRILTEIEHKSQNGGSDFRPTLPEIHWRPTGNDPIDLNVIHCDSDLACPAVFATSAMEFTRFRATPRRREETDEWGCPTVGASDEEKYHVTVLYFLDPHKTIETASGVTMSVADAVEAIGDLFQFELPQRLGVTPRPSLELAATAVLQQLWPPRIGTEAELVRAVLESAYNVVLRKRNDC